MVKREKKREIEVLKLEDLHELAQYFKNDFKKKVHFSTILNVWREFKLLQCLTGFENACREVERDVKSSSKIPFDLIKKFEDDIIKNLNKFMSKLREKL